MSTGLKSDPFPQAPSPTLTQQNTCPTGTSECALFGNRVFAGVISWGEVILDLGLALNPTTGVLAGRPCEDRGTQTDHHMPLGTEVEVRVTGNTRSASGPEWIPPQSLRKGPSLLTPRFWTSGLQQCERHPVCDPSSGQPWGTPTRGTQRLGPHPRPRDFLPPPRVMAKRRPRVGPPSAFTPEHRKPGPGRPPLPRLPGW